MKIALLAENCLYLCMRLKHLLISIFIFPLAIAANGQMLMDSTVIASDTATVEGIPYKAVFKTDGDLYILDPGDSVIFDSKDYCAHFEFTDFDGDGNKDIRIYYVSNIPDIQGLILYDTINHTFEPVIGFNNYPDPQPIKGTKFYYSYHRSGCADMNWDSDLFFIEDFKVVKIGNIAGRECENGDEKNGIYIYKVDGENRSLYKMLPVNTINDYKDTKWGFIREFWTENYQEFYTGQ